MSLEREPSLALRCTGFLVGALGIMALIGVPPLDPERRFMVVLVALLTGYALVTFWRHRPVEWGGQQMAGTMGLLGWLGFMAYLMSPDRPPSNLIPWMDLVALGGLVVVSAALMGRMDALVAATRTAGRAAGRALASRISSLARAR